MRADVEEVKGIMSKNIETIIERGDNLHNLQKKTSDLEHGVRRGGPRFELKLLGP